jgi:hypothetical protein
VRLADRAVISDIEVLGERVYLHPHERWYDISALFSPQEYCAQSLDMHSEGLAWAVARGLVQPHADHPHVVRIVNQP